MPFSVFPLEVLKSAAESEGLGFGFQWFWFLFLFHFRSVEGNTATNTDSCDNFEMSRTKKCSLSPSPNL